MNPGARRRQAAWGEEAPVSLPALPSCPLVLLLLPEPGPHPSVLGSLGVGAVPL